MKLVDVESEDGPRAGLASNIGARISANYASASKIKAERLADERGLYESKWFDYRFMNPTAATELFAHSYQRLFRSKWAASFDREESEKKRGLAKGDFRADHRELNSLWRARQVADGLGIPYDFFIGHAIDAALARGVRHLPRPNQLYNALNGEHILREWEGWLEGTFRPSELPQYRVEAFCGLRAQLDHQDWVVERIRARHLAAHLIGDSCFIKRVLPVGRAIEEFGEERVEQARREVKGQEPLEHARLDADALRPSCFALPHAYKPDDPTCTSCPKENPCRALNNRLRAKLVERNGSDDPVAEHRKRLNRERVARHRAKNKGARTVACHLSA